MNYNVPPPQDPIFVLGIPFLERYYTVYDEPNNRVGFAVAHHKGRMPEALVEADAPGSEVTQAKLDVESQADGSNTAVIASPGASVQLKPDMESKADLEVQSLAEVEQPKQLVQSKSGSSRSFLAAAAPLAEPY